jgi:hypothetical protein
MPVSFARDIKPLFRPIDIKHMNPYGVHLDVYSYMSDPTADHTHATTVFDYLTGDRTPRMPEGGPFWSQQQMDLYQQWMTDGFLP